MVRHLLVTNDFPPKVGGIQSYLWELWRRLPSEETAVLTTGFEGADEFDQKQDYRIERIRRGFMLPTPQLVRRINRLADEHEAELVLLDPVLLVGVLGHVIDKPYGLILHGAEVTIPGRLPVSKSMLSKTLRGAEIVIAAGSYPLSEAEKAAGTTLRSAVVPPGVDTNRFVPLDGQCRSIARESFGIQDDDFLLATVNRLVPRKGICTVIKAAAEIKRKRPTSRLQLLVGGSGRQRSHLEKLIEETGSPCRLLGKISDEDVAKLYGCADLMAMMCNERWLGLEQEGFGIAFLEAAASGVPQVAGRSGGSHEAVAEGVTGLIIDDSRDVASVVGAIESLMDDEKRRRSMGRQARIRAQQTFDYDQLAKVVQTSLEELEL